MVTAKDGRIRLRWTWVKSDGIRQELQDHRRDACWCKVGKSYSSCSSPHIHGQETAALERKLQHLAPHYSGESAYSTLVQ